MNKPPPSPPQTKRSDGSAAVTEQDIRAALYLAANPDVAELGVDPWQHYLSLGKREGRSWRSPFEPAATKAAAAVMGAFYLARNPDVAAAGSDPWLHYIEHGKIEGRPWPTSLDANVDRLLWPDRAEYRLLAESGLFDRAWYLAKNPDVASAGVDPIVHFLRRGCAEGRQPNPLFDQLWYLRTYPDVAADGANPFTHYLAFGAAEHRSPSPLFEPRWYLRRYPDVAADGVLPLEHYLSAGGTEGRSPSPLFDAAWYMRRYPDVAATGINPLVHFLENGVNEGRSPNPHFDTRWYLRRYPDVAQSGAQPFYHYLFSGAREGRRPCALPNGFVHYVLERLRSGPEFAQPDGEAPHVPTADDARIEREFRQRFPCVLETQQASTAAELIEEKALLEKALLRRTFDEELYVASNPDVANAVAHGSLYSGFDHWEMSGFDEIRRGIRSIGWQTPSLVKIKEAFGLRPSEIFNISAVLTPEALAEASPLNAQILADWQVTRERLQSEPYQPKISVILPAYNTDPRWLSLAIESVLAQIYDNWELCIVDDRSPKEDVRDVIRRFCGLDARIKARFREVNGHISAASNDALSMASGEYVALLDHDDELTPDALAKVVFAINENAGVGFLYTDEDKVDETGSTYGRASKPAWSPEFIRACGYTTHLSVYAADVIANAGGFRSEFDGAQDYDLTLRVSEQTGNIVHIPDVLYHWRAIASSTASSGDVKPYAFPRAQRALQAHMDRLGIAGTVGKGRLDGYMTYEIELRDTPLVSIAIATAGKIIEVNGRSRNLIVECVRSIRRQSTYPNYEIIVMENGNLSPETTRELLECGVRLERYSEPTFNVAQKYNFCASYAAGEYLIILNDDIAVISPDWIEQMLRFCQLDEIGAVGPKLLFPDDTIQHMGVSVIGGAPGHAMYRLERDAVGHLGIATVPHNVTALTGACFMTKTALFRELGGFDEAFYLNYCDVDYCLQVREAGYRIVLNPICELYHYESVSRDVPKVNVGAHEFDIFNERWGAKYQRERFLRAN